MRDFAFVKQEDGSVVRHVFIRTQEANQLTENYTMNEVTPDMIKFREKQENSSIDTLTTQLRQLNSDVTNMEKSLNDKTDEANITKEVLSNKLQDALHTLNPLPTLTPEGIDLNIFDADGHIKGHEVSIDEG